MKFLRVLLSLAFLVALARPSSAQTVCSRLSWGTCDPWVETQNFNGPTAYLLVWSITGTGEANVGTDGNIHIGEFGSGPVPDSWRFDDAGCQTRSQLGLSTSGLTKACPSFKGANDYATASVSLTPQGQLELRLTETYDSFTPNAANRYTAWVITFDHSFSSAGPTPPDQATCGGAELCEGLNLTFADYLTPDNRLVLMPSCDSDWYFPQPYWPQSPALLSGTSPAAGTSSGFALWNSCYYDKSQPSTWGRVKGLYR